MGPFREATEKYFRTEIPVRSVDEMAEEFRADDVLAVILAWDAESAMGLPPTTNAFVADCVKRHPDAFPLQPLLQPLEHAIHSLGIGVVEKVQPQPVVFRAERVAQKLRPERRTAMPMSSTSEKRPASCTSETKLWISALHSSISSFSSGVGASCGARSQ